MDTLPLFDQSDNPPEKKCTGICGRVLPATTEFFRKSKKGKYGLQSRCKECCSYLRKNPSAMPTLPDGYKKCTVCDQILLATTDYFCMDKYGKYGLCSQCKECRKKYDQEHQEELSAYRKTYREEHKEEKNEKSKLYYQEHREEINEKHRVRYYKHHRRIIERQKAYRRLHRDERIAYERAYYYNNRDELNKKGREYYRLHRDERLAYGKVYSKNHREERREIHRRYRQNHREEMIERGRRYNLEHREERRAYDREHREERKAYRQSPRGRMLRNVTSQLRRARKKNAPGRHTAAQLQDQYRRQNGKCYWCKDKLGKERSSWHADHVIPLSRGGSNDISNIVCACPTCNLKRGGRLPHEVPEMGRVC